MNKKRLLATFLSFMAPLFLVSPVFAATLSLSPVTSTLGRGCNVSVDVLLDTQNTDSDSADVILTYNPQQLTANSIVNGTIFSEFPGNSIDNQTGKVSIYGLSAQNTAYNGKGTVATINFTASSSATLATQPVNFDFDPSNPTKTTDSNVIQKGTTTDILKSVTAGSYTITSASCNQTSVPVAQGQQESTNSAVVKTLPGTGTFQNTLLIIGLGILFTAIGSLGFIKSRD